MAEKYNNDNIPELLEYIPASELNYEEWMQVGMALKESGFSPDLWENWSAKDPKRYHPGECYRKWNSFNSSGITAGTIVKMALDFGYTPSGYDTELQWDDIIGSRDEYKLIDNSWIEGKDVREPESWDPVKDIVTYLETLFDSTDNVGYVTEIWEKDGKSMPKTGAYDRTAGELISLLYKCGGDVGSVLGDYDPQVGAWIRFNPLDGKGVRNENVTDFRYALVESDATEIEKQNALIRELELPVACLVHSGKKSIHAIVKIEASSYEEYRHRVDYLYKVCEKNGLAVDKQNKNPSRLSRLPGVMRNGHKQFLIDTNIGKASWNEWKDYIEGLNDDLPDEENLSEFWDDLPKLSEPLIEGVLRQGHKMLVAGPSKAGKSYMLIELCCAIAEGLKWLGFQCTKGKVLYVNLELDRASCLHRFKDVYTALEFRPDNLKNIDIWNLRGKSTPMDKLAPKLIRRAAKKNYIAIIIDPIYKVITGDENSADQMAAFCNQFDKVCTELGCAIIYCHHHSKGGQGGKKSMDRASGSGVFARDPDALLDVIELELTEDLIKAQQDKAACAVSLEWLMRYHHEDKAGDDDRCSAVRMMEICKKNLREASYDLMLGDVSKARQKAAQQTAWRLEGTLREFPKFEPKNLWFRYPVHESDRSGVLKDLFSGDSYTSKGAPWKQNFGSKKSPEQRRKEKNQSLETAFSCCEIDGRATLQDVAEYLGVTVKTVRNRIENNDKFWISNGEIGLK